MKKQSKLAIVALVMVLVVVFMNVAFAANMLGDVNGDGQIRATDARMALRYSASLIELTPEQIKAADVNFDGKVAAVDARTILRVSASLIDMPKPPEETTEPTTAKPTEPTTSTTKPNDEGKLNIVDDNDKDRNDPSIGFDKL